jgi:hypothetical protein
MDYVQVQSARNPELSLSDSTEFRLKYNVRPQLEPADPIAARHAATDQLGRTTN